MKKLLWIPLALIIFSCASVPSDKQERVRFADKNISVEYDKKKDAIIYSGKWDNKWSGQLSRRNPLEVRIIEYGDQAGELSNTAWLEITITYSGNGYIGMEYVNLNFSDKLHPDRIILDSVQGTVNYNLNSNTFGDFWYRNFRGELAKKWADKIIHLSRDPKKGEFRPSISIYGSGPFYYSYYFTQKDKASLKALGEAWLKHFAEPE